MITKWYKVTCDYCGRSIGGHYIACKPTKEEIQLDGGICTATKQFCSDECYGEWRHNAQERRYMNLQQNGRIHNNE